MNDFMHGDDHQVRADKLRAQTISSDLIQKLALIAALVLVAYAPACQRCIEVQPAIAESQQGGSK